MVFSRGFFLAKGTVRRLSDGSRPIWKAAFSGCVSSWNICIAFLFSATLYIFPADQLGGDVNNMSQLCSIFYIYIPILC